MENSTHKVAHIWYDANEKRVLSTLFGSSPMKLVQMHESKVETYNDILFLLKEEYDVILLHLSHPNCLALKIGELSKTNSIKTKIVLLSTTSVPSHILNTVFDGHISKRENLHLAVDMVEDVINNPKKDTSSVADIRNAIYEIIQQEDVLKKDIRKTLGIRMGEIRTEHYEDTCMKAGNENKKEKCDVFISYSNVDQEIASEIRDLLNKENITTFLATDNLISGDSWMNKIKDYISASKIILLLLSPGSIKSKWVFIEAGAGWALDKILIPCTIHIDNSDLPELLTSIQIHSLSTEKSKKELINKISYYLSCDENS